MAERIHQYEMVVIANATLDDESLGTLNTRITNWISAGGGTLANSQVWGRRQLAYPIRRQTAGIYLQFNYQLAAAASRELDRNLRIDEQIVRHLIIRTDED